MRKTKKLDIVFAILLASLSFALIYFGIVFKNEKKLSYNESGDIDYKVYLKSNDDYNVPYLGKGRKYIASLIDHIDVKYNYKFKADKNMNYVCKYYIKAMATVVDSDEKPIYEKEQYLLDSKTKEVTGEELALSEDISIDYGEYNKLISEFSSKYLLSGNKNNLKVTLGVELKAKNDDFDNLLADKSEMYLDIPLTTQTLAVDLSYKEIDNPGTKIEISKNKTINIICVAAGIILMLVAAGYTYIIVINRKEMLKSLSAYEREKDQIFKKYSDAISIVDDLNNVESGGIVDVDKFSDLLNIRDCIEKPILFTEIKDTSKIALFMVVDNDVTYRYILLDDNK